VIAVVLALSFAAASIVLAAGSPKPKTMKLACAEKGSGQLLYVSKRSDCKPSDGKLVEFPAKAPVYACQSTAKPTKGQLFRVGKPAACKPPRHPKTRAVTLPKTKDVRLCARKSDGLVRVVSKFSACKDGERPVVLKAQKAPRANDDAASTGEETSKSIPVLANDTGAVALRLASVNDTGTRGRVVEHSNGTIGYDPNGDFDALDAGESRVDAFRYSATDGIRQSNVATVRVTVNGVNDAPVADDDTATTDKDTPVAISVLSNDTDPDAEALDIGSVDTGDTQGSVTVNEDGTVTYDPHGQFDSLAGGDEAHDSFTYRASDGDADSGTATVDVTITGVNHPPVVTTSAGSTGYGENDPATVVDGGMTVADDDDANLESATVRILSGFEPTDQLDFSNQNGITGTYNPTGVLTLTGTATKAEYQTALRSVKFLSTSNNPSTSKTVQFTANDGDADSNDASKALSITRFNDAPHVDTTAGARSYTEGSGAQTVDTGVAITDADSTNLTGAVVKIASSFSSADDELGFSNQNGISGSYNDSTGTLTLSGTASRANYETALRSVTYTNSNDNPTTGRGISFQVTDDGGFASNSASRSITFAGVNDAPTLTASEGTAAYTEGGAAAAVDPSLTLADVDDANLESAVVRVDSGAFDAGDQLVFSNQNGITGSYSSATGVLTLSGTSSKANYQAALRSIQFQTTNDNPVVAKPIDFTVNDGDANSNTDSRTVAVTRTNDAPTVTTTGGSLAYTEGAGAVAIDPTLGLTDPDSSQMSGATVSITGNFVSADDELAFTNQSGITGSYNDSTGVLTLSGAASRANYQTALRSVTYENVNQNPSGGTRTVSFQATDNGAAASNVATRGIALSGVNDAPTVTTSGGSTAYTEQAAATAVDGSLTVADVDDTNLESATVTISAGLESGDELVFSNQSGITGNYNSGTGVLTLSGSATKAQYQTALRSVQYRNLTNDNPATSKTVQFAVNDGALGSSAASKSLTITRVNDAPTLTASSGALAYTEGDGAKAIDPGIVLADPDSPTMTGATVSITSGFASAEDELGFTDQNGISGSYNDTTGVLTLTGSSSRANYETALRSVTYTNSSDDPTGGRTVSFQVTDDGAAASNTATRNIDVNGASDPPVVTTSSGTTGFTEDGPNAVVDPTLTVADSDDANLESATVRISAGAQTGDVLDFDDTAEIDGEFNPATATLTLTGSTSKANYQAALRSVSFGSSNDTPTASRTIEFKVNDGDADSAPASKDVTITPTNDPPVVTTTSGSTAWGEGAAAATVDSGVTVADPDDTNIESAAVRISVGFQTGDVLAFTDTANITGAYDSGTGVLTLTGTDSKANYQAALRSITFSSTNEDPVTSKTVEFKANDGDDDSNAATKAIAITPVNDAPVVTTSASGILVTEGDAATPVDGALTVTDDDDANLESAQVRISANFQTGDELSFTDTANIDGTYNSSTGVLTLVGTDSKANYQAALRSVGFRTTNDNPSASKTVEFKVNDGDADSNLATRDVGVAGSNDAPTLTGTAGAVGYLENGAPLVVDSAISITDPDSTDMSGATVSISANFASGEDELAVTDSPNITEIYNSATGVLTLSGTASRTEYETALRSVTYANSSDNPSNAARTISFQVADDGAAASNTTTRTINVSRTNDAPVVTPSNGSTSYTEGDPATTIDSAITVTDADDSNLESAVVRISSGFQSGSDELSFSDQNGIAGAYNASTGVLALSGTSSVANYQTALASVQFRNTSDAPVTSKTIEFKVNDGDADSNTPTKEIAITPVDDTPVAVDDTFNTNGNTVLYVGTTKPATQAGRVISGSVLANDTDTDTAPAGRTVTPVTGGPTTLGGTFTIEADGNFTYTPPTGQEGVSDTFDYTVTDGTTSDTGTVTIPLAERAWYVDNAATAGGTGRSSDPFDTLAEAESASNSNDTVYVFEGDGTTGGYDTGYGLTTGERLIGEASDLTMDPDGGGGLGTETYFSGNPANRPVLTALDEDVVGLGSGATVRGLALDPAGTGGGIFGTGAGINGGTIDNVQIIDGGTPATFAGLELIGTTGTFNVSDLTVTMPAADAVHLQSAGTVNFVSAGTIALQSTAARALNAASTSMGAGSVIDSLITTHSTLGGVSLINTTGTTQLGDGQATDLDLTTDSGAAAALFLGNAGSVSVPAGGNSNLHATGGPAVDVGGTPANLALDDVDSTGSDTYGVNLDGLGTGTFSASSGDITGADTRAFRVSGGEGNISYAGTLGDGDGGSASVGQRSDGTVTLSGPIADGVDAGGGIAVSGNTGGSTVFSNASKVLNTTTGDGVVMDSNTGHSVTFSNGGLDIDTTTGKGFEATAGGTVTVAGANNTIDTTTGRGLNVDATDIGSGGMTFRRISAGTAAAGPVNGIRLNGTGASGGLSVVGDPNADITLGTGGIIQKTSGDGVLLSSTAGPSLHHINVQNTTGNGIRADGVSGLDLADSQLANSAMYGISIGDLTGELNAVSGTNVPNAASGAVRWSPTTGAQTLTLSGTTLTGSGGNGIEAGTNAATDADAKLVVSGGAVNGNAFSGVAVTAGSGSTWRAAISGTTLDSDGLGGVGFDTSADAAGRLSVTGSTLTGFQGLPIAASASGSSTLDATITGNTIGTEGVSGSGSTTDGGIRVQSLGGADTAADVSDNLIHETNQVGIVGFTGDGAADSDTAHLDLTVTGNTVGAPTTTPSHGIDVQSGANNDLCLDISGNDANGAGSGAGESEDIRTRQDGTSVFRLERFTGDGTDDAAVASFLLAENPLSDSAFAEHTTGYTGVDDGTCQSPALP
jgi:Bacterial cadherin-like domain/Bacterial Ig domain